MSAKVLVREPTGANVVALFPQRYSLPPQATREVERWVELYRGPNEATARGVLKAYARATRHDR